MPENVAENFKTGVPACTAWRCIAGPLATVQRLECCGPIGALESQAHLSATAVATLCRSTCPAVLPHVIGRKLVSCGLNHHWTNSISPGRQVLSNHASSGP